MVFEDDFTSDDCAPTVVAVDLRQVSTVCSVDLYYFYVQAKRLMDS